MINNAILTDRIKRRCKERNTSVKKMLEQCQINDKYIYDVEKRGVMPSIEKIDSIADYLDCSIDYLVGRTDMIKETGAVKTIKLTITIDEVT